MDATFRYRLKNHQQVTIRARTAKIRFDLENHEIKLQLKHWKSSRPGADFEGEMDDLELAFPLPQEIGKLNSRHLTMATLQEKISQSETQQKVQEQRYNQEVAKLLLMGEFEQLDGESLNSLKTEKIKHVKEQRRFRTEIYSRFSMAASCLFFTLVGGPFSMLQARRQFITSFILCFLPILLVYYPVMFLMVNLAKTGTVDPAYGMWLPNLILGIAGMYVLRKVVQH